MHLPMSPFAPIPFPIGKVFGVTRYPLHISPAGNRSSSVTLSTSSFSGSKHSLGHWVLTSSLSWREQIQPGLATYQFLLRPEMNLRELRYLPVCSPAGKRSYSVALPTNSPSGRQRLQNVVLFTRSLSSWKPIFRVPQPTDSVSSWELTLKCSATYLFALRPEGDPPVSYYPPILFPAGNRLFVF